ncbi:MAG: 23S rRNA (pseudouridine(1915)-N(3))-methyltransferase RlmH [Oscillospiraceae bacterium]|nr:23S rRNA (pseudouridine(1915)-N(3))-methyltransferase RlmH [Oscillospiraceae bacterium]
MMNVSLIVLGGLREKHMKELAAEYEKRLSGYCRLNVVEIDPVKLSDNPSQQEFLNALSKEARLIKEKIPKNAYVFAMCVEGKEISSTELSKKLDDIALGGKSAAVFIIGSSFGLSDEIKEQADFRLSMSKMTFPHKLARIMLTEQIYRGFSISNNAKYHK